MNIILLFFTILFILSVCWYCDGFSLNSSGGGVSGDPAPGRSPGPPNNMTNDLNNESDVPVKETGYSDLMNEEDECELDGTLKGDENRIIFNISHQLFERKFLVPGVVYQGK